MSTLQRESLFRTHRWVLPFSVFIIGVCKFWSSYCSWWGNLKGSWHCTKFMYVCIFWSDGQWLHSQDRILWTQTGEQRMGSYDKPVRVLNVIYIQWNRDIHVLRLPQLWTSRQVDGLPPESSCVFVQTTHLHASAVFSAIVTRVHRFVEV